MNPERPKPPLPPGFPGGYVPIVGTVGEEGVVKLSDPMARLRAAGFTDADLARLKKLAEQASPLGSPPALDDLDAPFRAGVVMYEDRDRYSGRLAGRIGSDKALLVWPKD